MLTSAIMHTEGGSKTSIDYLQSGNREAYDKLVYRIAGDYYFFYDGADNRTKAANWYEKVLNSKNLSAQQLEIANSLYKIGNYYASLGKSESKYDFVEEGSTYWDYWNNLIAMTEGNLMEKTGQTYIVLGLYKNLAVEIYNCAPQFKASGVGKEEMLAQLEMVENGLREINTDNADDEDLAQKEQILGIVEQARSMVNSTFASVSSQA